MGKNYYTGPEDFIYIENTYDKLIENNFKENEEKIKGDFKAKIRNLQNFYEEMNKKYQFQNLDKKTLHQKLKDLNSQNKAIKDKLAKNEPFLSIGF